MTYSKTNIIDYSSGGDSVKVGINKNDDNIDDLFTAADELLAADSALNTEKTFTTVAKTANYTLTAADCNGFKTFTNYGAIGDIILTLPSAATGLKIGFVVSGSNSLRVNIASDDYVSFNGENTSVAGYLNTTIDGTSFILVAINTTEWVIINLNSTINFDE